MPQRREVCFSSQFSSQICNIDIFSDRFASKVTELETDPKCVKGDCENGMGVLNYTLVTIGIIQNAHAVFTISNVNSRTVTETWQWHHELGGWEQVFLVNFQEGTSTWKHGTFIAGRIGLGNTARAGDSQWHDDLWRLHGSCSMAMAKTWLQ